MQDQLTPQQVEGYAKMLPTGGYLKIQEDYQNAKGSDYSGPAGAQFQQEGVSLSDGATSAGGSRFESILKADDPTASIIAIAAVACILGAGVLGFLKRFSAAAWAGGIGVSLLALAWFYTSAPWVFGLIGLLALTGIGYVVYTQVKQKRLESSDSALRVVTKAVDALDPEDKEKVKTRVKAGATTKIDEAIRNAKRV